MIGCCSALTISQYRFPLSIPAEFNFQFFNFSRLVVFLLLFFGAVSSLFYLYSGKLKQYVFLCKYFIVFSQRVSIIFFIISRGFMVSELDLYTLLS